MNEKLLNLFADWEKWQDSFPDYEKYDGWETAYPNWDKFKIEIIQLMKNGLQNDDINIVIEKAWYLSFETEDFSEYAFDHIDECWSVLTYLVNSKYGEVRCQVYNIMHKAGKKAEKILHEGLNDDDSYCRNQCILSLIKLNPKKYLDFFVSSENSDIRYIVLYAIEELDDKSLAKACLYELRNDKEEFIRDAAVKALEAIKKNIH